ncbi:MAG: RluA family pseudouridine synthase [Candidatus Eisenbacteria bacterium]|nr:RluA family pseudouridine synthase [Candidatus Eisenbacteria bacterium]
MSGDDRNGGGPRAIRLSTRVDPYHDGWRLSDYLAHRFRYLDAATWAARLAAGSISVNGAPGRPETPVGRGDLVEYEVLVVEPPVDFSYEVLHDDEDVVAVSKSGNIPCHAGGSYFTHTLIARLREDLGRPLDLAHRLDRETSGVVVLAGNREAARALSGAFARGEVAKEYVAVVRGEPSCDAFEVDAPIAPARRDCPVARRVVDRERGRPARTLFRVESRRGGFAVVRANPLTGRTNQIRLHLEHAGHPIVGDKIYGMPHDLLLESLRDPSAPRVLEHLLLARHALHAARLELLHPRTRRLLTLEAPLPADMAGFVAGIAGDR